MSAPRDLDHVVVTTPDLAAAVGLVERTTGVAPEPGGAHPRFGTRNYLVSFGGDTYLELLGVDEANTDVTSGRPFGLDDVTTTSVSTWAIHPGDLDAARTRAADVGIDPGAPYDGSRRTESGELLEWRLTRPVSEPTGIVPFLIDWGSTTSPAASTAARLELVSFTASHPEPETYRRVLAALGTDLEVAAGEPAAPGGAARALGLTVRGPAGELTF
ncbi:VOC family protein [Georgenia sp. Z1344]|uniref:VOC family protein n=1 Tax=Georgenia sp. Z1344 TaxID=3416706 RepID=UPI003CF8AA21